MLEESSGITKANAKDSTEKYIENKQRHSKDFSLLGATSCIIPLNKGNRYI